MNTPIPLSSSNATARPPVWAVVMGVAGCGKSTLAQRISTRLQLSFIEGDDFHPTSNVQKMRQGTPLTDDDRKDWLNTLVHQLQACPQGAVLSCSALKRSYRERLRAALPQLRFIYLEISEVEAGERVRARAANHIFPTSLVASQFASLQAPVDEDLVLHLQASTAPDTLCQQACDWLLGASLEHPTLRSPQ
jgi:gluconokinase